MLTDGICRQFGIDGIERENIVAAARLHDIGKIAIPPQVLDKAGPLNDAEWALMRRHTVVGQEILDAVPEMGEVARLVRHSHERWNGDGYPDGIADEEIPLGSRIVACADAYHAIRSNRAYRRGRDADAALAEIVACGGSQFDPDVADALEMLARETRAEVRRGPTTYRSTRLAALLLILAFGLGASAVAHFGSPFSPKALADPEPPAPNVAAATESRLELATIDSVLNSPELHRLIFDLGPAGGATAINRVLVPSNSGGRLCRPSQIPSDRSSADRPGARRRAKVPRDSRPHRAWSSTPVRAASPARAASRRLTCPFPQSPPL